MFSDTHFHFRNLVEERSIDGTKLLTALAEQNPYFELDIGTRPDDLLKRQELVDSTLKKMSPKNRQTAQRFLYFTAGIWPDINEIKDRFNALKKLEESINIFEKKSPKKLSAIGECGLDHHWNLSGVDGRCEEDFSREIYEGEKELFQMQIELAKKLNLPVVIHSREAFDDTIDCIRNMNYNNGIIHCYSYGIKEAKVFLDLGWHIAFGGAVTYTKKSKLEEMIQLLNYIPQDRLLLETDSPYLAPVPFRGQTNTPLLIEHVYNFIAEKTRVTSQTLSDIVDLNIKKLFNLTV